MFALVDKEDNSIVKMYSGNKGVLIGENQYPQAIFSIWTEAERNAINIYEVTIDESKRKDEKWYINTNITYSFDGTNAKGAYGDATPKPHADANFTAQDEIDGLGTEGELKSRGLKYRLIQNVKLEAANELAKTDWYVIRKTEEDTAIPSAITTHRRAVRSKQAAMETSITNASDTPALETLYTYVNTADEGDPVVMERPIGEIPTLD